MKKIHSKGFFVLLFVLLSYKGFSQLSTTHYIPPMTQTVPNGGVDDQHIYISTASLTSVRYEIFHASDLINPRTSGTVTRNAPVSWQAGRGDGDLFVPANQTSRITKNGFIITASAPIGVSVRFNSTKSNPSNSIPNHAAAYVSRGEKAKGNRFRVGAFNSQGGRIGAKLNFYSFMATEDGTVVNLPNIRTNRTYAGGPPLNSYTLNKYESVIIALSFNNALVGDLIDVSSGSVVAVSGSAVGSFTSDRRPDFGVTQLTDESQIGEEYIFVKGEGGVNWEKVLLIPGANPNGTANAVSINGNPPSTTINASGLPGFDGANFDANGIMHVKTFFPDATYYAFQGMGTSPINPARQGLTAIAPLSCENKGSIYSIPSIQENGRYDFNMSSISIVTKVGATISASSTDNGNIPLGTALPVQGNTDYVVYKITTPNVTGNFSIECDDELYCTINYGAGSPSIVKFYTGSIVPPTVGFNKVDTSILGLCLPNLTSVDVTNIKFDRYEWAVDREDGNGFQTVTVSDDTSPVFTPTEPGTYKVTGFITCNGDVPYESNEFVISLCPEDSDNDGVPNNMDIDMDNDGILNTIESDVPQPINVTTIGSATPSSGNTTTPFFTPSPDGTFTTLTSAVTGGQESSVTYTANFATPLNILVEQGTFGSGTLTPDQEFIIQVSVDKTITLQNTDNQLLIDTDFDGVYEANVTNYSGFQIRFKVNGSSLPVGSGTFAFHATNINQFIFKHENTSNFNGNAAVFKISETFKDKDSDTDTIPDYLDNDSDNDGIPDIIESLAPNHLSLSGSDSDNDGLDNAFDINATQVDSDNDTVLDYLDLDSDNDGIYDVQESGSNLPDTNFDGIIDSIASSIGTNGWDDNAETAPDSGLIGYTLNNVDNDTLFSYLDLDSDDDTCNDVTEAGFADSDNDGLLGDTTPTVNNLGLVNNASNGYTGATDDYITFGDAIAITTQPINTTIDQDTDTSLSVNTNADIIQWQVSIDNGATWTDIADNVPYSGTTTNTLSITEVPDTFDGYQYRAVLTITGNDCEMVNTDEATLTVELTLVIVITGFSPNNDGKNDTYTITNLRKRYPNFSIQIFNRWGQSVYKGNIDTPDWNGKQDNTGKLVPVGVYFYVVNFNEDDRAPEKGEIYLSR